MYPYTLSLIKGHKTHLVSEMKMCYIQHPSFSPLALIYPKIVKTAAQPSAQIFAEIQQSDFIPKIRREGSSTPFIKLLADKFLYLFSLAFESVLNSKLHRSIPQILELICHFDFCSGFSLNLTFEWIFSLKFEKNQQSKRIIGGASKKILYFNFQFTHKILQTSVLLRYLYLLINKFVVMQTIYLT